MFYLLNLEYNNIGIEWIRYLSKTKWVNVQQLNLSIICDIKQTTESEMKAVYFYPNYSGTTSMISNLVSFETFRGEQYRR